MDALSNAIKIFVKGILDEASKRIAEKFDVSIEEASSIWSDIQVDLDTIKSSSIVKKVNKKPKKKINKSDDESDEEKSEGCIHKFLRGPRSGECCKDKISSKSQTGNYCTKHIIHENKAQIEKKTKNTKKEDKNDMKYKITKNKFGNYTHSATGLVFRSAQEKVIYGRQDDEGVIHPLTEEDLEVCKKFKFPVAKDAIQDREVQEEDVNEEEIETD